MTWLTKDNIIIATAEDLPEGCFGFVYRIDNLTNGKFYIGKKQCFSNTKKKFGKRKLEAMTDKRSKKYEFIQKESDWAKYNGSNKELLEDIKKGDRINKTILEFGFTKYHLTYLELKHQCIEGVLETEYCYNDNLLGKFYRSVFDFTKR